MARVERILCHNIYDIETMSGGFIKFPKYLIIDKHTNNNSYRRLSNIDNAIWPKLSLSAKSILPVLLYYRYINEHSKTATVSQDTMCELSGIGSRNTVSKVCNELRNVGILKNVICTTKNSRKSHSYEVDPELEEHSVKYCMDLPKYVIKGGLWAKLGKVRVAQSLYWAMRSFEYRPEGYDYCICDAGRKDLCKRAGIADSSFPAAHDALVEFGFMPPL